MNFKYFRHRLTADVGPVSVYVEIRVVARRSWTPDGWTQGQHSGGGQIKSDI